MTFLVLCSICWSSSLIHFNNGPVYLTIAMLFGLELLYSSSDVIFVIFFFNFHLFEAVVFEYFQVFVSLFFFLSVLIFPSFCSSLPSVLYRFPLYIHCMAHFSMPNSIPIFSLYMLTACISVSNSFSFFVVHIHLVVEFTSDLHPLVHFLSKWNILISINWITMTRKSGKHLHVTYGTTTQLFWPY